MEHRTWPDPSEPVRAHSAGWERQLRMGTTTGLSTLGGPGSVAYTINNPGLVTGYARMGGDAPQAVICPDRALHDLNSLLLPASAPARPACDPTNPCTRRTHREGLSCPDPSAASASHCQRY